MKNEFKWWDEYEVKARYIPTFLSCVPLTHFLVIFFGSAFWGELYSSIGWMLVIPSVGISVLLVIALSQIQCSLGKFWIEESVFEGDGKYFLTTDMLLYSTGLNSKQNKRLLRRRIAALSNCKLATAEEEQGDPHNARLLAREAVGHVRGAVGRSATVLQCNIRYGFFRNLIAGMPFVVVGSGGCAVMYYFDDQVRTMYFFIGYLFVFVVLFACKKVILKRLSFSYADVLFNEYLKRV